MLPILIWSSLLASFVYEKSLHLSPKKKIASWRRHSSVVEDQEQEAARMVKSKSPLRKIVDDVQRTYTDLKDVDVSRSYSSNIKISYMKPPSEKRSEWTGNQRNQTDATLDTDDCIFEQIAQSHGHTKTLLLYLPGLDGVGISAVSQFPDLAETFELWRMSIDTKDDRSSFTELTTAVSSFINSAGIQMSRQVILVGESFGGLLASSVAMRVQSFQLNRVDQDKNGTGVIQNHSLNQPIKGLVLINPATSFDKTVWSSLAPLLATLRYIENEGNGPNVLPTPYSVLGGVTLAATVPDSTQIKKIISLLTPTTITTADDLSDLFSTAKDGFSILANQLPAEVIEHRVSRWLPVGCSIVNPRLHTLQVQTVVIAGKNDNMLPSRKEAERLSRAIPNCTNILIEGAGHFVLDERVNLTKVIIESPINPYNKPFVQYDPIIDWKLPSMESVRDTIEKQVKPLRALASPIFLSTGIDGTRRFGVGQIPCVDGRPILFVGNHQFGGLDLGMIIAELIEKRGIVARGLAHPIIFANGNGQLQNNDQMFSERRDDTNTLGTFQQFGAVMVGPRNYYRLMESGQNALLFPGGVREVFHGKNEAYKLFWPDKVDFVRTAAKFNAIIVTVSAIGAADSANILLDSQDILKLPFGLGQRANSNSKKVKAARYDDTGNEIFQPPIAVPKPLPSRHYFLFGRPIATNDVDYRDKTACENLYREVKGELERGINDLLSARVHDPFSDNVLRIAYERISGKSAPTFSIDHMNKRYRHDPIKNI